MKDTEESHSQVLRAPGCRDSSLGEFNPQHLGLSASLYEDPVVTPGITNLDSLPILGSQPP